MLRFIYTDELELEDEDSMTTDLLQNLVAIADRYDLSRLKLMCAQKLWEKVSVENVATILIYAEMHGCPELKTSCLDFFVQEENFKEAVLNEGYAHCIVCVDMPDSGFLEFQLDYAATKDCAIGDIVRSDVFPAGGHAWNVMCYPCGDKKEDNGEYLSLFLELASESMDIKAIFDVFLMGKDDEPSSTHAKRCVRVYSRKGYTCAHLGGLLDHGDGTDVSFVSPYSRLTVPCSLPARRCSVPSSSAESKMSSIVLQDMEPLTFRALLRFIYTDELPTDGIELKGSSTMTMTTATELFQNLLAAADRYDLSRLKLMCAQKLWETVQCQWILWRRH
uniref:BTB domain-containing protein n=1 Tax=Oryza meridionalis TaxID=40149 RepID=A0A0E0CED4_9ORYZ